MCGVSKHTAVTLPLSRVTATASDGSDTELSLNCGIRARIKQPCDLLLGDLRLRSCWWHREKVTRHCHFAVWDQQFIKPLCGPDSRPGNKQGDIMVPHSQGTVWVGLLFAGWKRLVSWDACHLYGSQSCHSQGTGDKLQSLGPFALLMAFCTQSACFHSPESSGCVTSGKYLSILGSQSAQLESKSATDSQESLWISAKHLLGTPLVKARQRVDTP